MSVLQLHTPPACDDVVATLRRIADEIEAGKKEFPVTTCIVLIGHTNGPVPAEDDAVCQRSYWNLHGFGPRSDVFTVRGLMASAMHAWMNT